MKTSRGLVSQALDGDDRDVPKRDVGGGEDTRDVHLTRITGCGSRMDTMRGLAVSESGLQSVLSPFALTHPSVNTWP